MDENEGNANIGKLLFLISRVPKTMFGIMPSLSLPMVKIKALGSFKLTIKIDVKEEEEDEKQGS